MKISPMLLSFAALLAAAAESEPAFNLLPDSKLQPMRMNGEVTGLHAWSLLDYSRIAQIRDSSRGGLLDGRDIFKLDCKDGVFSVEFKDPGLEQYYRYKQPFVINPDFSALPIVHADRYRATGFIRLSKGVLTAFGRKKFNASGEWQRLDYSFSPRQPGLSFVPVPGLKFAMKDIKVTAEYDRIGGSIALPGGGRLTALVMPKNAPYQAKRLVLCWRGWLWKLTGTALPVHEREQIRPQKGCLVFMPGKIPHGGYDFVLNKDGGTLVYGWPFAINTALYNYLREYGYVRYDRNNGTNPPSADPKRILLAADMKCRPKYSLHTESGSYTSPEYAQGTVRERDYYMGITDWYAQALNTNPHCSNQLMPPPSQRKIRPESQMMFADGRRQTADIVKHPQVVSPCLTDPSTREYMLNRILDIVREQDRRSVFYYALGDLPDAFCHCSRCMEQNEDKTGKTYASVFFDFINEAAARIKKRHPDKAVAYCAYHTYTKAPAGKKVSDNIHVLLCLGGMEKPCNVHLDCELNRSAPWRKDLTDWLKLVGPERLGVVLYDAHNPFTLMDILEELSKYSARHMHLYTFSMIEQYTASRWNQGDDPKKIVEDYNNGVFGADAGKYVTAIQRLVYEFDKKYQHRPGEFSGNPGRIRYYENLDRKTFDAVYALFGKAEKVIRARKGNVVPLLWEKFEFMTADLRKFPRSRCETDAELKAFALRVAEFVRISIPLSRSKQYPYLTAGTKFTVWNIPARTFLLNFCGLNVPVTKKFWTDEPVIVKFMSDPVKQMIGNPEKSHGHWRFQHTILRGGENGMVLRRESSGKGRITAVLNLEQPVQCVAILSIAGWDDEKPGKTTFRILVNDREIFSGANTFPETADPAKTDPGHMVFSIPAGMLKKGENRITLVNTVQDDPQRAVRQLKNPDKPEDGYTMKQDYYWGWLAVNELRLIAPDDEFVKYAAGSSDSAWSMLRSVRPFGKITHAGGKVTIQSAGARSSGIIVPLTDSLWLLPKGVKFRMRAEVTGKGLFCAGVICYPADFRGQRTKDKMLYSMQRIRLNGNDLSLDKNVAQGALGYCCPYIYIEGDGNVEIRKFSLVPVTPEK